MTSQFDADINLWNGVSGHKDDCHARRKSLPGDVWEDNTRELGVATRLER